MCFQPIFVLFSQAFLQLCPIYQDIFYVFSVSHHPIFRAFIIFLSLVWQRYAKPPMDVTCYAAVQHVQFVISIKELEIRSFGHSVGPADNKLSLPQKAAEKREFMDYAVVWKVWIDGS